jgi:hypothetical protein
MQEIESSLLTLKRLTVDWAQRLLDAEQTPEKEDDVATFETWPEVYREIREQIQSLEVALGISYSKAGDFFSGNDLQKHRPALQSAVKLSAMLSRAYANLDARISDLTAGKIKGQKVKATEIRALTSTLEKMVNELQ